MFQLPCGSRMAQRSGLDQAQVRNFIRVCLEGGRGPSTGAIFQLLWKDFCSLINNLRTFFIDALGYSMHLDFLGCNDSFVWIPKESVSSEDDGFIPK